MEEQKQQSKEPVEPEQQPMKQKKPGRSWGIAPIITSPWVLLLVPLLVGGFWLINHTDIITNNLNQPYALLAGPVAIASGLLGWFVVKFFATITLWSKQAWLALRKAKKEDGSAVFFWLVIVVFMVVSVFASGDFFTSLEHNAVYGLGYVTALFIDLVAVQSMKARLNAVRMRDKRGEWLYLIGVFVCAGASAFANVYTSLADFNLHVTGVLPSWMLNIAPWFGLVFPALILLLSITADYTLDQTSTKLDPEHYKEQENKRIRLLEAQRDSLKQRREIEKEIDQFTNEMRNGKARREFFLVRLLFPVKQPNMRQAIEEVKEAYAPQVEALVKQNQQLQEQLSQARKAYGQMAQQINVIDGQRDTDNMLIAGQISGAKNEVITSVDHHIALSIRDLETRLFASLNGLGNVPAMEESKEQKKVANSLAYDPANDENSMDIDEDVQVVVDNYPIVASWLSTGVRSVTLQEIIKDTGHTPQMVHKREKDGTFRKTKRAGYYRVDSVITWLKTAPLPRLKETTNASGNGPISEPITGELQPVISEEKATSNQHHNDNHNGHSKTIKLDDFEEMTV